MKKLKVIIDGKEISVKPDTTILEAANQLGIHIPTLCYHSDFCASGICRVCVVEVENDRNLEAACAYQITRPLTVHTHTSKVRNARRDVIELMMAAHCGDCLSCPSSGNCELQSLAKEYGVDHYRFSHLTEPIHQIDNEGCAIVADMNKCILCRRCVRACTLLQDISILTPAGRSNQTKIAAFADKSMAVSPCINCGQCVTHCPTGALWDKDYTEEIWKAIEDSDKHVIIQTAPSPRAGIGEEFGLEPGTCVTFQMNTALRECGFDKVFDTNFSADLTIIEESTELITRLYKLLGGGNQSIRLPMLTSCCPGWIKYIEHYYPEYLPNLSSCKSPQQMLGTLLKTYYAEQHDIDPKDIVSVSVMPCMAKKFECNRPEMNDSGFRDVDFGLTTREVAKMIRESGIDLPNIEKSDFDHPFGSETGSGIIFGATGGVMESAIRSAFELITGQPIENLYEHGNIIPVRGFEGIRYAELTIPEQVGEVPELLKGIIPNWDWLKGVTLKVGVAHGGVNLKKVMEDIKAGGKFSECHFIEFMACPGGCLAGGGQPMPINDEIRKKRAQAIYHQDSKSEIRKSYENPAVVELYREFLTDDPNGHKAHQLLHTSYKDRGKYIP